MHKLILSRNQQILRTFEQAKINFLKCPFLTFKVKTVQNCQNCQLSGIMATAMSIVIVLPIQMTAYSLYFHVLFLAAAMLGGFPLEIKTKIRYLIIFCYHIFTL